MSTLMKIKEKMSTKTLKEQRSYLEQKKTEVSRKKMKNFFPRSLSTMMMKKKKILFLLRLTKYILMGISIKNSSMFNMIRKKMLKIFLIFNQSKKRKRNNSIWNQSAKKNMQALRNHLNNTS